MEEGEKCLADSGEHIIVKFEGAADADDVEDEGTGDCDGEQGDNQRAMYVLTQLCRE